MRVNGTGGPGGPGPNGDDGREDDCREDGRELLLLLLFENPDGPGDGDLARMLDEIFSSHLLPPPPLLALLPPCPGPGPGPDPDPPWPELIVDG